jgi:hypothetical protein
MANSVYKINKGINKPIEFKGLKAQYIWYLGAAVVGLLILFTSLYIAGVNTYLCLFLILVLGSCSVAWIYSLSNRYGEFGMMKKLAAANIPTCIKSRSRKTFINLKKR